MSVPVYELASHRIDDENNENESPIFVRQIGTFQFSDGKAATCVTWAENIVHKFIIKNQEDDYDI